MFLRIFGKNNDDAAILAEHGRWIARLRDDVKVLQQSLHSLERRASTIEGNLAELAKLYGRLDISISKLETDDRRGGRPKRWHTTGRLWPSATSA
ncbi:MAG: hypothetical protein ABH852_01805 [Methanobacteriota archaeon]